VKAHVKVVQQIIISSPIPKWNKMFSVFIELLHADSRIDRQTWRNQ